MDNPKRLVISLGVTFFVSAVLIAVEVRDAPYSWLLRYIALTPILYITYHYGFRIGLMVSSLFSIIYIPELIYSARIEWTSFGTIYILSYFLIIHTATYVFSSVADTFRSEAALTTTVMEWGELSNRIKEIDVMISFILEQVKEVSKVEYTFLTLMNPLIAQWEIHSIDGKQPITPQKLETATISLPEWLLSFEEGFYLNHLDKVDTFIKPVSDLGEIDISLRSVMMVPLRSHEGSLLGQLILLNKKDSDFQRESFVEIRGFIVGIERALEQASLYIQTDYSLAQRVKQLATIQRTARELNSTLDLSGILNKTLDCAIEITGADSGLVYVNSRNIAPTVQTRGYNGEYRLNQIDIQKIKDINDKGKVISTGEEILPDSPNVNSILFSQIRRENQNLGFILVENSSPIIFKDSSRHVLSILADHAAIALENTQLFEELKIEQLRISMVINSLSESVLTTDLTGKIITLNPSAEKMIGYPAETIMGKLCCEVIGYHGEDHTQKRCSLLKAIEERKTVLERRIVFCDQDSSQNVYALNMTPIPASKGHPEGCVLVFRDITEKEELDNLQKELIAAISHELRAPLSNINSITEVMVEQSDGIVNNPFLEYLPKLVSQTKRLADFSDRIIDVYKMETGQFSVQLRPIPIHLVVDEIIKQWKVNENYEIVCRFLDQKSPWVWADENGLQSIFNNLIDNAIKYSPPKTRIEVIVEKSENGFVTCGVKDQGPGIDPKQQEKIFNRFYRIDGKDSQRVYGHGLGLYICKNLINAMGGKIWVSSEYLNGSYFAFSLRLMEDNNEREDTGH